MKNFDFSISGAIRILYAVLFSFAVLFVFSCKVTGIGMGVDESAPDVGPVQIRSLAADPPGGSYTETQTVTLSTSPPDVSIWYTLDGGNPENGGETSLLYGYAIEVEMGRPLKAVAVKEGMKDSEMLYELYTLLGTVVAPMADPPGRKYPDAPTVELFSGTPGAAIRFTLDGSDPAPDKGTLYTQPVIIPVSTGVTTVLKAIAFLEGKADSVVMTERYTKQDKVQTPTAYPPAGDYDEYQDVTLGSEQGAAIWYTLDGSDPATNGIYFTGEPISVEMGKTLKAVAKKDNMITSDMLSAVYTQAGTTAMPEAWPPAGNYDGAQSVSLDTSTEEAAIYYTLDGSDPAKSAARILYEASFNVATGTTVRAVATKTGMLDSEELVATYTQTGMVAMPVATPGAGIYPVSQSVSLTSDTPEAVIYYSLDGSDPEAGGIEYNGTFSVEMGATLRAVATKEGLLPSNELAAAYIQQPKAATPEATPGTGSYVGPQEVSLSSGTEGAEIWYTLDTSIPISSDTRQQYTGGTFSVTVSPPTSLRAIAVKDGMISSDELLAVYSIAGTVVAPVPSPLPGAILSTQLITLSSGTGGAAIYYTTDNSPPSVSNGTLCENGGTVSGADVVGKTLKAIAVKEGMLDSGVLVAAYTQQVTAAPGATAAGTFTLTAAGTSITITAETGASIYYTTNGSTAPTTASTKYNAAFAIGVSTTLRAIAVAPGKLPSAEVSRAYTMKVATPTVNANGGGTYTSKPTLKMNTPAGGPTLYYATGTGSAGNPGSTVFPSAGLLIQTDNFYVKVKASKAGCTDSDVVQLVYRINMVTGISISPTSSSYTGFYLSALFNPYYATPATIQFTATVGKIGNPPAVTWSVSGTSNPNATTPTAINSSGLLTFCPIEQSASLTVTASCAGYSATATVKNTR